MNIKRIVSLTTACALALSFGVNALADANINGAAVNATAIPYIEDKVILPVSVSGSQILDTGDSYYIAINELPACENGTVLVYNKATGAMAKFATASNISQLVYVNDAIYALTPYENGVYLIRITDKCEALLQTEANVLLDQLSLYEGRLYFLMGGKLMSIMPDGSDMKQHSDINMGEYIIVDGVVYFTNMDDKKAYAIDAASAKQPPSIEAGCLYSLNLASGVPVKLLGDGVKSIRAYGSKIYLQNMGESYAVTVGATAQPAGRLCSFDPLTRKLERLDDIQNEYSYFPSAAGMIVHTAYDIALYANNTYAVSLYKPEQGASVYGVDDGNVMVYEPVAQRLTLVSTDMGKPATVIFSGTQLPEAEYTRPTLSPISSSQPVMTPAITPAPTYRPTSKPTARPTASTLEGVIFQDSAKRRLTEREIRSLKNKQLIYARYEILARNGYVFKDKKYLEYYRQFDWYREDKSFKFTDLDNIESYNYELIRSVMNDIFATPRPTARPTISPEYYNDFIFPHSSEKKLTRAEVLGIDRYDLLQARYEILARNGYVFDTASWQRYFEKKKWYIPDKSFKFGDMSWIESYNYELIRNIDAEGSATPAPTAVPEEKDLFVFPDALDRKLTRAEVLNVDKGMLLLGRYEILARNGYVFDTASWQRYFEKKKWYIPDKSFKFGDMSRIESYNYELIRNIDKKGSATPAPTAVPEEKDLFVFPDALDRKLTSAEVLNVDKGMLLLGRYEILARNGYVFDTASWQRYFEQQSWYMPDESFKFGDMDEIDSYNYELIRNIDKEGGATPEPEDTEKPEKPDQPNPTAAPEPTEHPTPPAPTDPADAILLIDSDKRIITLEDLMRLDINMRSPEAFKLMRDEILARHGYVFDTETEDGLASDAYFRTLNWYSPDEGFDPSAEAALNEFEIANYNLIQLVLNGEYGDPLLWDEAVG